LKHRTDEHKKKIMVCLHVLDDNAEIGVMDDDCKKDTIVCQNCLDRMVNNDLPEEVHIECKECVLKQLQGTITKVRIIKKSNSS